MQQRFSTTHLLLLKSRNACPRHFSHMYLRTATPPSKMKFCSWSWLMDRFNGKSIHLERYSDPCRVCEYDIWLFVNVIIINETLHLKYVKECMHFTYTKQPPISPIPWAYYDLVERRETLGLIPNCKIFLRLPGTYIRRRHLSCKTKRLGLSCMRLWHIISLLLTRPKIEQIV